MNVNKRSIEKLPKWVLLVVVIIAAAISFSLIHAQLGDDEAMTLSRGTAVANAIRLLDAKQFALTLLVSHHPPARNLITVPFLWLIDYNEVALRFPNILGWIATAVVATFIGNHLGGWRAGLLAGIFIGGSGLFSLQAMGHGHGFFTLWIMLLIWHLLRNPSFFLDTKQECRAYAVGGICCIIAFLWFTSAIAVAVPYHAIYGYYAIEKYVLKRNSFKSYIYLTVPFVIFYLIYYFIFLGIPAYFHHIGIQDFPGGQLHQNLARSSTAHLNIISLIENLQAINGMFFPFLSWALLAIGTFYLLKHQSNIFIVLIPYAVVMSFYISGGTPGHFLAYFSWILPFSAVVLTQTLKNKLYFTSNLVVLTLLIVTWSTVIHIIRYQEYSYPDRILNATFSRVGWYNNIVQPYDKIISDLELNLNPGEHFTVVTRSAAILYYFDKNKHYETHREMNDIQIEKRKGFECLVLDIASKEKKDEIIKAAVSYGYDKFWNKPIEKAPISNSQDFCPENVKQVIYYPKSDFQLTLFSTP